MKYCPYCGTQIVNDESYFCVECGKELPAMKFIEEQEIIHNKDHATEQELQVRILDEEFCSKYDEGYDGYYDELLPIDDGQVYIGIDKTLIKKIILLVGCVLLVITLCLVMMYVF